ncbi:MAG: hypothetical protein IH917_11575 [Acidobacteria bacterium]|nr:hypothetical protein [Acidobacteriota bacterium]
MILSGCQDPESETADAALSEKPSVDNAGHKVIAGMRARQTPGVFSVTNDLLVASEVRQEASN